MSYLNPSLTSRADCEMFGVPTGPEPDQCWSCDKPISGEAKQTPDGPQCADCTRLGHETLIRELGMTPEGLNDGAAGMLTGRASTRCGQERKPLPMPLSRQASAGTGRHQISGGRE